MRTREDLTNRVFGRYVVLSFDHTDNKETYWRCECQCDNKPQRIVRRVNLMSGRSQSCGCYAKERQRAAVVTHGYTIGKDPSPEYKTWTSMKSRCSDKNNPGYKGYGGRGIAVCDEWCESFVKFLEDMGPRPKNYSLERKDNNGPYAPWNCVWASFADQMANRRVSINVVLNGQKMSLTEACRLHGLPYYTVWARIKMGWSEDKWFTPLRWRGVWTRRKPITAPNNLSAI